MKISLNWIKDFTDVPEKYSAKTLAELLTVRTCEVEGFEDEQQKFTNMIAGKIIKIRPHPNADKLRLVDTDIGGKIVQIVCGGKNLAQGMIVPVALPGAQVNWHGAGEVMELKETKIRGEASFGMICAGEEIGLPPSPPEHITDLGQLLAQNDKKIPAPGTPLAKALNLNDIILEIDNKSITHRPDLWGHYGIAREFSAFLGKKLKSFAPKIVFPKSGPRVKVDITKSEIAARFITGIITNIRIEESPQWIKRRLQSVGMRPVNNVVDITNYVMHELGQPLHAFDRSVVGKDQFLIRYAKKGETTVTLDHKKRILDEQDALVTNGNEILGIAGIMGGVNCEITPKTTEIVLEVATWNSVMIRKTAQKHGLRTDAAQRFEKSLDPEIAKLAFLRACELILKICKGSHLAGPPTDIYPRKAKPISVLLEIEKVNKKIGVKISEKEIASHLKVLEFGVQKGKKGILKIIVPSFRATKDINIEDDLIEEIARMHGYEKIAPDLPVLPVKLPMENRQRAFKHKIRQILSLGLGFCEANLYSFYGKNEIKKCMLPENLHLKMANPLTEDQTHLRISLLPNLLNAAALNANSREYFKIYEIGRTYIKGHEYFPREEKFICGILTQPAEKPEVFYEALDALNNFSAKLGIKGQISPGLTPPPYAHPSKYAVLKTANIEIAAVYEIHPQILENYGIKLHTAAFEINFTQLASAAKQKSSYKALPRFPGIEIDISTIVPKRTTAREVMELMCKCGQNLIADINLIDIFENKSIGEDKKSFTFRVLLQSPDRTLTDNEMKEVQTRIFKTLTHSGFEIRGLK